jgi:hypothetical protein
VAQERVVEVAVDLVLAAAEAERVADDPPHVVIPIDAKLCTMIVSVFFRPTRPP